MSDWLEITVEITVEIAEIWLAEHTNCPMLDVLNDCAFGQMTIRGNKLGVFHDIVHTPEGSCLIVTHNTAVSRRRNVPTPSLGRLSLSKRILGLTCCIALSRPDQVPCCRRSSAVLMICGMESFTVAIFLKFMNR